MTINIVFPVLNEDERLKHGIEKTSSFLADYPDIDYKITIVDNGSDELHQQIAIEVSNKYPNIHYIYLPEKGVGGALQAAVQYNDFDIIGYMDVDLATPPKYLIDVLDIFKNNPNVNIINASRLLKSSNVIGRKIIREISSRLLNALISIVFRASFTDAMCGFKYFRKDTIEYIAKHASNDRSWFYCAELLLWAEKLGYSIYEIPVDWHDDPNSKVKIFRLARQYLKRMFYIRKDLSNYKKLRS